MLQDQISKDYVTAMKAKDSLKSSTINFLRAQLKNVIIEKKVEALEDVDVIAIIKKQVKQRQDSIEQYGQGGRQDLVDKETQELEILKSYLPEELSEEVVAAAVKEAIAETGAHSMKDMGVVMKATMAKTGGQADNKLVSEMVKKALAG
jgi:uncharacterized protein YqeY